MRLITLDRPGGNRPPCRQRYRAGAISQARCDPGSEIFDRATPDQHPGALLLQQSLDRSELGIGKVDNTAGCRPDDPAKPSECRNRRNHRLAISARSVAAQVTGNPTTAGPTAPWISQVSNGTTRRSIQPQPGERI
jgi:hypothetical protein